MRRQFFNIIFILGFALAPASLASQPKQASESPLLLSAENLTYDKDRGTVRASGNVEVAHNDRLLMADSVLYNEKDDVVIAKGQVKLLEPSGDVFFADSMKLTGNMKNGIIQNIRVRLADNSRIAAADGRRSAGKINEMRNAVYSPCESCGGQDKDSPLWQLKAKKVIHNEQTQMIEYRNAWMEMFGIPVAYTPYFTHPGPKVKRKTGFIAPKFGTSNALGGFVTTPYFIDLGPNKDLTLTPTFNSKEWLHMAGEYRALISDSRLDTTASLVLDSNDEIRGHIDSKYRKDIDDTWRAGIDVNRATDDTYLRKYKIAAPSSLTTRAFGEAFRSRDYLKVDSYLFQDLSGTSKDSETPIVLPMITFNHISKPTRIGSTISIEANAIALTRTGGRDTQKLSLKTGWHLPRIGNNGEIIDIDLTLQSDAYHINQSDIIVDDELGNGLTGRLFPQGSIMWRYPLSKPGRNINQLLEPIVSFVYSPNGGNPKKIPNDDSLDFEFDTINLFSPNRFTGIDRVEGGSRLNYGLRWGANGINGGNTAVFFGQSYRFRSDSLFPKGSGLEDNFSDLVGSINISPSAVFDLSYRTRLSHENLSPNSNEIELQAGQPSFRVNTNYTLVESQRGSEFGRREEISGSLATKLTRMWRNSVSGIYDLDDDGQLRTLSFDLTYECECFTFTTKIQRDLFSDRDLRPNSTILFQLTFKTLGDIKL